MEAVEAAVNFGEVGFGEVGMSFPPRAGERRQLPHVEARLAAAHTAMVPMFGRFAT